MVLWTKKKVLVICSLVPVVIIAIFGWTATTRTRQAYPHSKVSGVPSYYCSSTKASLQTTSFLLFQIMYIFLPGVLLLFLSIAIAVKMAKISKQHNELTHNAPTRSADSRQVVFSICTP